MLLFLDSIVILLIILLISRAVKRRSGILQRYFIPSSLVAGALGLILGPQVIGVIPQEVASLWSQMPKYLITVVFAGLFLGKSIPGAKKIWQMAGPMISFGMVLAWGQYVIGIFLTMVILEPFFGANPLAASLIEISFEGGHGTAAGLAPTFEKLGWPEGTDIALGMATVGIIAAIISGILLINLHNHKKNIILDAVAFQEQKKNMIQNGYNLMALCSQFEKHPRKFIMNIFLFLSAIAIGWIILESLVLSEDTLLRGVTDLRFFSYIPLFPLAMIGGLCIQVLLEKAGKQRLVDKKIVHSLSGIALDFLIASALATVSLCVIGENFPVFFILSAAGIVWVLGCFILLSPRMFKQDWFENGITNIGQSMGMTATGLLLNKLADPSNRAKARESFAYKQLVFEPFMGGGLVTAISAVIIYQFGLGVAFAVSLLGLLFWLGIGLLLPRINDKQ